MILLAMHVPRNAAQPVPTFVLAVVVLLCLTGVGCTEDAGPLLPIPLVAGIHSGKVELGRMLFHEPRLSRSNTLSCASCHDLKNAGADSQPRSTGVAGQPGRRNTPTVFNSAFNRYLFWDGRTTSLADQIDGPVHSEHELGSGWMEILNKLSPDDRLVAAFDRAYGDGMTIDNMKNSIAAFERSLVTPHGRFDSYLRGDASALTPEEADGYQLFRRLDCVRCHFGINLGGNSFARAAVDSKGTAPAEADLGRFRVTGRDADKHMFRVPGLRAAPDTAPYFHDGSVATLDEALEREIEIETGRSAAAGEIRLLNLFLHTLTGSYTIAGDNP